MRLQLNRVPAGPIETAIACRLLSSLRDWLGLVERFPQRSSAGLFSGDSQARSEQIALFGAGHLALRLGEGVYLRRRFHALLAAQQTFDGENLDFGIILLVPEFGVET